MTVTMSVAISFDADTPEEGQAMVHAMNIPEGAQVNVNANVHLVAGVVDARGVVAPPGPPEQVLAEAAEEAAAALPLGEPVPVESDS
jgi:hypothetical protein